MKIRVKKEVELEIEVTFPVYLQYGFSVNKLLSPAKYISVKSIYESSVIEVHENNSECVELLLAEGRACTEEVFDETYEKAIQHLQLACELQTLKAAV